MKLKERLKRLGREDREFTSDGKFENRHYSKKGSHKLRSIGNSPRKRSKRR